MFYNKDEQELTEGGVFCQGCGTDQSTELEKEKSRVVELLLGLFGGISGLFVHLW